MKTAKVYLSSIWSSTKTSTQHLVFTLGLYRDSLFLLTKQDMIQKRRFLYLLTQMPGGELHLYAEHNEEELDVYAKHDLGSVVRRGYLSPLNSSGSKRGASTFKIRRGQNATLAKVTCRAYEYPFLRQEPFSRVVVDVVLRDNALVIVPPKALVLADSHGLTRATQRTQVDPSWRKKQVMKKGGVT